MHAAHDDNTAPLAFHPSDDDGWKGLRKELKREQKRERDQVRLIDGWEQYRTLWDGIEFKRQLIKMGDTGASNAFAPWIGALLFNRSSSFVMSRQVGEIRKAYQRLKVLVVLAALVMTLVAVAIMAQSGGWLMNAMNGLLR